MDDTDHIVAKNWLHIGTKDEAVAATRIHSKMAATPLVPVAVDPGRLGQQDQDHLASPGTPLPLPIHLLSLDRVAVETTAAAPSRVLVRVHHSFQPGESTVYSSDVVLDLSNFLPANLHLADVIELPLNGVGVGQPVNDLAHITMRPLQTRTFEATLARKSS